MKVIFLWISGFYSDSDTDESLKYGMDVPPELEQRVLDAMGWASMQHVPPDEHLLTKDQVEAVMKTLGDPVRNDLVYYIGLSVKHIPRPS
ncbi:pyocin S6 family toxin immunity protein [Pseudomonas caspiana]|uniref:pyocin S6 family toxin immunity protein n=1 Tax=Pseudomonas caspiana TaxID=1451454 RepID=UPI0032EE2CA5